MDWATVGNFSAPAALEISDVIPDAQNKNPHRHKGSTNCSNNTTTAGRTSYQRIRACKAETPETNTSDPALWAFDMPVMGYLHSCARHGFSYALSYEKEFPTAVVWRQCDSRCGARRVVRRRRVIRGQSGARGLQRAVLTGPQPQCIGLPVAETRPFFPLLFGSTGRWKQPFCPHMHR